LVLFLKLPIQLRNACLDAGRQAQAYLGDQECFIPRATMAIALGEKAAHKKLNPTAANVPRLLLVASVTAAAAAVSRAAFCFPSLVAGNNLNLGERWSRGCLHDR
jgi:hypothetical protein